MSDRTFVSALHYRDPRAAVAWLERAFGFEITMAIESPDEDPTKCHYELGYGGGATVIEQEPEDQFYGDRTYRAVDPEGHVWTFSMHVRDVSREEAEQAIGGKIQATDWT